MKKSSTTSSKLNIGLILLVFISFVSCEDKCENEQTLYNYRPVYTSLTELRSQVAYSEPQEIEITGKIFFKDSYLFINEPNKGIHIIDNHDPANPVNKGFITVPGSYDLAVKGNMLYTDSYIDLVIIDISDINNIHEAGRKENVFNTYNTYGYYATDDALVTSWEISEERTVVTHDCNGSDSDPVLYDWGYTLSDGIGTFESIDNRNSVSPTNPGMGGSMARFALAGNYLYTLNSSELITFNLASPESPSDDNHTQLSWDIETIFPKNGHLFIGTRSGMHIMDLTTDPLSPTLLSTYAHVTSCDPVIVDDNYAYVTLRSGTECEGFTNQLEVIDISDLTNPKLLHTYEMTNPHGLGKDGNLLFICDGSDGLKVFNAEDISDINNNMLEHYKDIQAYDIIPFQNIAMMIGEDGLFQYDYSDMDNITLLSHIQIKSSH
ncbi:hypothetical protein LVD15_17455 [Fulvivirga maritima]|uniref:LVIVD repeat-containing protein n=1 Tax=Fulvivirga maritima TaxID=2904247 RepID=UPI001F188951|nr:hypothetical protein [Fulvivirga maritima]UII25087.1 hypothetical protein LVD15_17455 [Fulvivirga maritima]